MFVEDKWGVVNYKNNNSTFSIRGSPLFLFRYLCLLLLEC